MNYTIASLDDVQGNMTLELASSGNKTLVQMYNKDTKKLYSKEFDNRESAYKVFERIAQCICLGSESFNDRLYMLSDNMRLHLL